MTKLYQCLRCRNKFFRKDLSKSYLCYRCAKRATLENFELMWRIKKAIQEEKRESKTSSN